MHPDDLERAMVDVKAHLDGLTPTYVNEHRVQCKDGSCAILKSAKFLLGSS